jgi:hypothetical protein
MHFTIETFICVLCKQMRQTFRAMLLAKTSVFPCCAAVYDNLGLDIMDSEVGCFVHRPHIMASPNGSDESSSPISKACQERNIVQALAKVSIASRKVHVINGAKASACAGDCVPDRCHKNDHIIRVMTTQRKVLEMKCSETVSSHTNELMVAQEGMNSSEIKCIDVMPCENDAGAEMQTPRCIEQIQTKTLSIDGVHHPS